jgi:hypothetical protein
MGHEKIVAYLIKEKLDEGKSPEEIRSALLEDGLSEVNINTGFVEVEKNKARKSVGVQKKNVAVLNNKWQMGGIMIFTLIVVVWSLYYFGFIKDFFAYRDELCKWQNITSFQQRSCFARIDFLVIPFFVIYYFIVYLLISSSILIFANFDYKKGSKKLNEKVTTEDVKGS